MYSMYVSMTCVGGNSVFFNYKFIFIYDVRPGLGIYARLIWASELMVNLYQ